ncbi:hypothetical protein D3C81_2066670 [compost metagenome]
MEALVDESFMPCAECALLGEGLRVKLRDHVEHRCLDMVHVRPLVELREVVANLALAEFLEGPVDGDADIGRRGVFADLDAVVPDQH